MQLAARLTLLAALAATAAAVATPGLAHAQTAPRAPVAAADDDEDDDDDTVTPARTPARAPTTTVLPPVSIPAQIESSPPALQYLQYGARGVPYREVYRGGPVPRGARVVTESLRRLALGGLVLFSATHVLMVLVGGVCIGLNSSGRPVDMGCVSLMLPGFGPLFALATVPGGAVAIAAIPLVLVAGAEVSGIAMAVAGVGTTQRVLVYDQYDARARPPRARPVRWSLLPFAAGTQGAPVAGATFALTHF